MKNESKWVIDPSHSDINFKVRHLVISTVTGSFGKFEGSAVTSGTGFADAEIEFSADVDSVNTNAPDRDNHLKSDDFFSADKYPKILFKSKSFKTKGGSEYLLVGDLTIRDVTEEVTLDVEFGGVTKDPWGNDRAGFELAGKLSRRAFGLKWDALTEAGGAVVGDEVKLQLNVELVKQA